MTFNVFCSELACTNCATTRRDAIDISIFFYITFVRIHIDRSFDGLLCSVILLQFAYTTRIHCLDIFASLNTSNRNSTRIYISFNFFTISIPTFSVRDDEIWNKYLMEYFTSGISLKGINAQGRNNREVLKKVAS